MALHLLNILSFSRNENESQELDMLEQQARDFGWSLVTAITAPNFEESRKNYEESLDNPLKSWEEHLQGKLWVLGDRVTYVDFLFYEWLDWHYEFKLEAFQPYPGILAYLKRFEDLPNIKEHMCSDKYCKYPILGPMIKWGYQKE